MFDTTEYKKDLSFSMRAQESENLNFTNHFEDTSLRFGHKISQELISQPLTIHTGRLGGPEMLLEPQIPNSFGFTIAANPFKNWFMTMDSIQYYNSSTPRTDLRYAQATGDLLLLRAEHSQNIAKNWNFGVNYQRIKTNNLYYTNLPLFNQERMTNLFSTQFFSHYYSMNRKYEVFASFTDNKSTTRESFGLANSQQFDTLFGRAKTYSGIANFTNATNIHKERTWSATQFFRPGLREIKVNDSTTTYDSTTSSIHKQWFHELSYTRTINQFTDDEPNLDLYPIRFVSLETNDSFYHSIVSNRFGYSAGDSNSFIKYWLLNEIIAVRQHLFHSSNYQHVRLGFEGNKNISSFKFGLKSYYSATGYNRNDYGLFVKANQKNQTRDVSLSISQNRRTPDYNDQFFGSNYYYWNQSLNASTISNASLNYSLNSDKLNIELVGRTISNFVYYGLNGAPSQLSENLQYINANALWKLNFLSSYTWENRAVYQRASSTKMPIPSVTYRTRIYKEGYLFKNNMWARFGVEVSYFSAFSGTTYNPVVRQFTLSDSKVGGYPVVDVFLNTSVRTMDLYVSTNHVTQGNFINDSYSAAFYPLINRTFQFGINWRLFD